jgi:putative membrane protein
MFSSKNLATLGFALILGGALSIPGIAQTGSSSQSTSSSSGKSSVSAADQKFMKEAAQGGQAEVELGQLAQQKAQSPDVKAFGQRMVNDHTKANEQLKQVASQKGVTLPSQPDAKDQAEKARLEKMSGAQFDKSYMNYMVSDHKKDVADFQKAAAHASDPDVKNFAQTTLPTLQSHLQEAESITPKQNAAGAKASTTAENSNPR